MFQMPGPRVVWFGREKQLDLVQNRTIGPFQFLIFMKMRRNLFVFFR